MTHKNSQWNSDALSWKMMLFLLHCPSRARAHPPLSSSEPQESPPGTHLSDSFAHWLPVESDEWKAPARRSEGRTREKLGSPWAMGQAVAVSSHNTAPDRGLLACERAHARSHHGPSSLCPFMFLALLVPGRFTFHCWVSYPHVSCPGIKLSLLTL